MKHLVLAMVVLLLASPTFAQEDALITVLKSDAPTQEKAAACRALASVGTQKAVPVLVSLLADETLAHMGRYALEPIDDLSIDMALRKKLGELKGLLLVGVIDSLGVRKDTEAVGPLAQCLRQTDPEVTQAAARALGNIGGPAAQVLGNALSHMSDAEQAIQLAICEGLLRCAEAMPDDKAVTIYDRVRDVPNLPHHVQVAALRGAILSRGDKGVPLWISTIRGASPGLLADAMGISMDMAGKAMTRIMASELLRINPEVQFMLLQTLGYRGDTVAAPAMVPLAKRGPVRLRIAAIRSLVQLGTPSSIPVLAVLVKDSDATVSKAAQAGLIGFPGKEVDMAVVAMLNEVDARYRMVSIDMVGQRRMVAAVPSLLKATDDASADVVNASFKRLGELAGVAEIPDVVNAMLKTHAVVAAESALAGICARQTDKTLCSDKILPGLEQAKGKAKLALLRVLRTVGDPKALTAVRAAAGESDKLVSETAIRLLCDWPTVDALPDLAKLANTTESNTFRILAIRGQLRLIPKQTGIEAQKLSQVKAILPLIKRTEEQRLVLALLGRLSTAESLQLVLPYLTQEMLKEEACVTVVGIAEKIVTTHPEDVVKAMKQVRTGNKKLGERVKALLALVPEAEVEEGFTSIFNGKDLTGWDGKPGWWTVEDGALTAESTPEKPCKLCNYLIWEGDKPADFELLAEFKLSGKGNSGIQIRSETRSDWDTYGYQADMTGDGELIGFVYHHKYALIAGRGTKAVFAADGKPTVEQIGEPEELLTHYKQGDWNTYRVVCDGPDISLYINGVLMCQITDLRVADADRYGIIALQMHPGPPMKIQFKNIRIKVLK